MQHLIYQYKMFVDFVYKMSILYNICISASWSLIEILYNVYFFLLN